MGGKWKTSLDKTWMLEGVTDGPNHTIRPKEHRCDQGYNSRLIMCWYCK